MAESMILCPVCRVAVADKDYDRHAAEHQRRRRDSMQYGGGECCNDE